MSTRCHIVVRDDRDAVILYRHSDGYPDGPHGVLATLVPLVSRFLQQRGFDVEYLSAQIIADQIRRVGRSDMCGFGICTELHGDQRYTYTVTSNGITIDGCDSSVTEQEASGMLFGVIPERFR